MIILALQIGSTEFAASPITADVSKDEIHRVPIPARGVWETCRDLLLGIADGRNEEVVAVGIASPGPIDMTAGVIAPADIREWRTGFAIVDAVRKIFPAAKVTVALDGVCLGLAERNFGPIDGMMDVLVLDASQHITAAVMVGGFTVVGRTGNAGHIGHVLIPGFDESCGCGGRGCLEAVAGGVALLRWAGGQGWRGRSLNELVESADGGDAVAVAALNRAGTALGRAIASTAPLLDFDLVIIGGVLAKAGPALWKSLRTEVATYARLSFLTGLRTIASELGDVGVLAGAGVMAAVSLQPLE
jgi:glucokinase